MLLQLNNVAVEYVANGRSTPILSDVTLNCDFHQILTIVGPSGIGKTTLLKAIAGVIPTSGGQMLFNGSPVTGPSRERGLVFQNYCVFPWLTVRGNIELGSQCGTDIRQSVIEQEVEHLLTATGLWDDRNLWPRQLSGGMQQRVAIARTLAADPQLLLLDEPFGALDAVTRLRMQRLIGSLFGSMRQAIVMVTHDIREAVSLSDSIALLVGKPASVNRVWQIPNPRGSAYGYRLSDAQEDLIREVYARLNEVSN